MSGFPTTGLGQQPLAPDWTRAACAGMPIDAFFPSPNEEAAITAAKAICTGCPIRDACLQFGLGELHGIWGGTTEGERTELRRRVGRRRRRPVDHGTGTKGGAA